MDMKARCEIIRAMDLLVRAINNEAYIPVWLTLGVADGDIRPDTTDEDLASYVEDDVEFADLMDTFLWIMEKAKIDGGLYVDRVVSKPCD